MIRVNLLPQKKSGKRGEAGAGDPQGQLWMGAVLVAVLLEVLVLFFVYKSKQDQLTSVQRRNEEVRANIEDIKRTIANHTEIKTQLKELRDREEAIQKLQSARTGPTATLLELSKILTQGRGPTADRDKVEQLKRDNPMAVPNPNWDPRRLWITNFVESNRDVKVVGMARDGEDVSEFLRRLSLSDYFYDVKLLPATKAVDQTTKLEMVKFEMSAKVRY